MLALSISPVTTGVMTLPKTRRNSASIASSRWASYATAGAATALLGATVETANADIHYVSVNTVLNSSGSSSSGVFTYLNLAGNAQLLFQQFYHSTRVNGHANFAMVGGVSVAFVGYTTTGFGSGYVSRLAANNNISGFGNFVPQGAYFNYLGAHADRGQFVTPGVGFLAFRFNIGNGIQYGWARVNMGGGPGNPFTVVDYAWGDVGDMVSTGQVPEPGSLALLALGGVGLIAWRKKRAQAASAV